MKYTLYLFAILISCSSPNYSKINQNKPEDVIDLQSLKESYEHEIDDFVLSSDYLILKSGDNFFGEITKLVFKKNKIYLLDGYIGKIVLVFDFEGNLLTSFSHQGEGPREFNVPTDMWINDNGHIELLNESLRKVITYDETGEFIKEKHLSFVAEKFIKTEKNYFFYTNNIAFAFDEDNNKTGLLISTDHNLNNPTVIVPADLDRKDFYYVNTQNFASLNNQWFFFQPFSNELKNLSNGNNIKLEFGDLNFPKDFFANNPKKSMDLLTDLYNLGKAWDNGAFYDLEDYIYFKFQINLTVYMTFYNKNDHQVITAKQKTGA